MQHQSLGHVMILGANGMVGSSICRMLERSEVVAHMTKTTRVDVDLLDQHATFRYLERLKPDWLVIAAARVGGIYANNVFRRDFLYENLSIEINAIEGAYRAGIPNLLFLGSSCIYPRNAAQPIQERSLLTASLEPTNEPYAIAKIAGIKLVESYQRQFGCDFRACMPANLYGPNDNYHPTHSHVIPALIRRIHTAKKEGHETVSIWGTGRVRREFLYVDDLGRACIRIMLTHRAEWEALGEPDCQHVNVGAGVDMTISELAAQICEVVDFSGVLQFDDSKPDGVPQKLLSIDRIKRLGWEPVISLKNGLFQTYEDFVANHE
jgi:GDP-L-fucose synthase